MQKIATIPAIVDQHAEDAAFLWFRRRREIDGPILGETGIGRIDQRLNANIDGLMASGRAGWDAALARFGDYPDPGELFVVGVIAFRSGESDLVTAALGLGETIGEHGLVALSGAIARTPRDNLRPFVAAWLDARDARNRCLALSALWHNRIDPGQRLGDLLASTDLGVRLRALRLTGALKRRDLLPTVLASLDAATPQEKLAAALAACLLGEWRSAHEALDRLVLGEPAVATTAIETRLLTTPVAAGKSWLQKRLEQPALRVAATAAIGLFEDKSVMPWLIAKMRDPMLAEAAGRALRDLFEVDFGDTDLFTIDPAVLGPEFADVEDGPWPVADRVAAWWDDGRGGKSYGMFKSMRRLRLTALRAAFTQADIKLADWRATRRFPAWM